MVVELSDEPGLTFAVPIVCVAGAATTTNDIDQLILLGCHELGEVTPVLADRWRKVVTLSQLVGGIEFEVPFLAAEQHDAYILTASPQRYPDSGRIIEINDD
jgi:hypothetical protein